MKKGQSKAPAGLKPAGRAFWRDVMDAYRIADVTGRKLLLIACKALDDLEEHSALIEAEGWLVADGRGSRKRHPAALLKKESYRVFIESVKALGLEVSQSEIVGDG